jgi:hypothetical protein
MSEEFGPADDNGVAIGGDADTYVIALWPDETPHCGFIGQLATLIMWRLKDGDLPVKGEALPAVAYVQSGNGTELKEVVMRLYNDPFINGRSEKGWMLVVNHRGSGRTFASARFGHLD